MDLDVIHHASCEDLAALDDGSVALTVTSPPYWNAVDYDIHQEREGAWYRTRRYSEGFQEYEEYLDWLTGIFGRVLEKTRPGGFGILVIGTILFEGRHYPAPFDLTARLSRTGWEFHQDIVWNKVTGGVKRAGVLIQKPYPGYYYPNIMTEYLLVLRRPGESIYRSRSIEEKEEARVPIDQVFKKDVANSVWHIAPVPPRHLDHPCPFPEEIPYRLIRLYSYPGDIVLDPFAGSGQTLKVAKSLGRRFVGYETQKGYVEYARRRLEEPLAVRPMQILPSYEPAPLEEDPPGGRAKRVRRPGKRRRT